jgi:hypothetical protein
MLLAAGLPDFSWYNTPKNGGKIYEMPNYTKLA